MNRWLTMVVPTIISVGLLSATAASCSKTPSTTTTMATVDSRNVSIPRSWRSCETDVPALNPPVDISKVQNLINTYDNLLSQCAKKLGRVVGRIDQFNEEVQ